MAVIGISKPTLGDHRTRRNCPMPHPPPAWAAWIPPAWKRLSGHPKSDGVYPLHTRLGHSIQAADFRCAESEVSFPTAFGCVRWRKNETVEESSRPYGPLRRWNPGADPSAQRFARFGPATSELRRRKPTSPRPPQPRTRQKRPYTSRAPRYEPSKIPTPPSARSPSDPTRNEIVTEDENRDQDRGLWPAG